MRISPISFLFILLYTTAVGHVAAQDLTEQPDTLKKKEPERKFFFGFSIGTSNPLVRSAQLDIYDFAGNDGAPDTITDMTVRGKGGMHIGIQFIFRLHKNLFVQLNPNVTITSGLTYTYTDPEARKTRIERISQLDLPVAFAYKFKGKYLRPVVSAGMDLKFLQFHERVRFANANVSIALEKKMKKLIFSPEIRYSMALNPVLIQRMGYTDPPLVDRMKLNTFCVILNFIG